MFQNKRNIVNQLYSNKIYKKKINVFQIGGIQQKLYKTGTLKTFFQVQILVSQITWYESGTLQLLSSLTTQIQYFARVKCLITFFAKQRQETNIGYNATDGGRGHRYQV